MVFFFFIDYFHFELVIYFNISKIEYKEAKSQSRNLKRQLTDLEKQLELKKTVLETDFGPNDIFLALYEKSFETSAGGYNYELKPFDYAKQGTTSLG